MAFGLAAAMYALDPLTRPRDGMANPWSTPFAGVAAVLFLRGMAQSVALPARALSAVQAGGVAVALAATAAILLGRVSMLGSSAVIGLYLFTAACLAGWGMRREPGSGHGLVFTALMLFPALVASAWRGWFAVPLLRYTVVLPLLVTGMTLLATGLLRAHRRLAAELQRAESAEAALTRANDTLEQRVGERTAELNDMVGALEGFNRHVAHDLRGPLGGIAGAASLAVRALQDGDRERAQRLVQAIGGQADASVKLVAALLSLARVGDAPLQPRALAPDQVAREALAQVRLSDPASAAVPVHIETPQPPVHADPDLLRQVYVNLLGNAAKFSRGRPGAEVRAGVTTVDGQAAFLVRDNGVGFDADAAAQLFQPFRRLHGRHYEGHGIGLSIVRRIVERHGGRVWCESAPGEGAAFFFTLPAAQQA